MDTIQAIPRIPDPDNPKHVQRYGPNVAERARGTVHSVVELLPEGPGAFIGVRYLVNPDADEPEHRLKIFLNGGDFQDDGDFRGKHLIAPFFDLESATAEQSSNGLRKDCTILAVTSAELLSHLSESSLMYGPTEPDSGRTGEAEVLVFDDLIDSLQKVCVISIFARPTNVTDSQRNAIAEETVNVAAEASGSDPEYRTRGSRKKLRSSTNPVAARIQRELDKYLDRTIGTRMYRLEIQVASNDSSEAELVARTLGRFLSPKGHFTIQDRTSPEVFKKLRAFVESHPPATWKGQALWSSVLTPEKLKEVAKYHRARSERLAILAGMATLVDSNAARRMLQLPVTDGAYLKTIAMDTEELDLAPGAAVIVLGVMLLRGRKSRLLLECLVKHLGLFGGTGYGKSNLGRVILSQLWLQHGIPFLVVEMAKAETRQLLYVEPALAEALRVFTPGKESLNPARLNPLEVPPNITVDEHAAMLVAVFQGVLSTGGAIDSVLAEALHWCYYREGIRGYTLGKDIEDHPTLIDLMDAVDEVINERGYAPEVESNISGATKGRIKTFCLGLLEGMFGCKESFPSIDSLLEFPTVFELQALDKDSRNLVALFLLLNLRQCLRALGPSKELRLVIMIEESHNLAAAPAPGTNPEVGDPKGHATQVLIDLLAEIRSYGVGVIIADQSPVLLAPEILKHTSTKIVGRPNDEPDRKIAAEAVVLDPIRHGELAVLKPGEFFLFHEGLFRPVKIKADLLESADKGLHGRALTECLSKTAWYQEICEARLQSDCESLLVGLRKDLSNAVKAAKTTEDWTAKNRDEVTGAVEKCGEMIGVLCTRAHHAGANAGWLNHVQDHYRERFMNLVTEDTQMLNETIGEGGEPNA